MATSYASWSLDKLKKEVGKIEKIIKTRESQEKKKVLAELKTVAKKHGFALDDLVGSVASKSTAIKSNTSSVNGKPTATRASANGLGTQPKKRAKAKIKYRNPSNRQETWTGRGRQPRWVAEFIKKGGSLDKISV